MAPRKRPRPNRSQAGTDAYINAIEDLRPGHASQQPSRTSDLPDTAISHSPSGGPPPSSVGNQNASGRTMAGPPTWYGSWPRTPKKSSPSIQLATETIMGGTIKPASSADLTRFDTQTPPESSSAHPSPEVQDALPLAPRHSGNALENPVAEDVDIVPRSASREQLHDAVKVDESMTATTIQNPPIDSPPLPTYAPRQTWIPWPFGNGSAPVQPQIVIESQQDVAMEEPPSVSHDSQIVEPPRLLQSPAGKSPLRASGWFDFWPTSPPPTPVSMVVSELCIASPTVVPSPTPPCDQAIQNAARSDMRRDLQQKDPISRPSAGSTWAFWSTASRPKSDGSVTPVPVPGEIAIIGERSEAHPKHVDNGAVQLNGQLVDDTAKANQDDHRSKTPKEVSEPGKGSKRPRPYSLDTPSLSVQPAIVPALLTPSPSEASGPVASPDMKPTQGQQGEPSNKEGPKKLYAANLLLPSFSGTYKLKENLSILQQIARLILPAQTASSSHLFRVKETPKLIKAIAIGVHGLFPASYLRPMIGQPTGTSVRFADLGANAIRRWADSHGCAECEIEKVALEGEGKIAERVDNLWRLLLNWIDHLKSADLIILACHSQGVPVGVMLVAKLIDLGIITNARIGVCAMAGVSLGPFPDYKSSLFTGSAAELWEFANPNSELSQRYQHALSEILSYGVRITFVGSIDDQLVPLESAIYSSVQHPCIYRAVFIDGRIHAADFIADLVAFALKLRNLGVTDHGLIRELSTPLAGSLYSGEGHSRVYYDDQVYNLAVTHALETTSVGKIPCEFQNRDGISSPNPYNLPWVMRGLLEEGFVKTELSVEMDELLRKFDAWKPVTKPLKDVKYRLEAVRSRL